MKKISFLVILLLMSFWINFMREVASENKLTFAYLTPRGDDFYKYSYTIAKAACKDLGVELIWLPANNDPELYKANAKKVLIDKSPKVDAVLYKNFNPLGRYVVEWAEKGKIPVIAVSEGLSGVDRVKMGQPREKYKYWIGEFISDQFEAGYNLGNYLVDKAKASGLVDQYGKVHLVALTGNSYEGSSIGRVNGLHAMMGERSDVIVHEVVGGYWKLNKGRIRIKQLIREFPETSAIWVANDSMAVGAIQALKELGLSPEKDFVIGGTGSIAQGMHPLMKKESKVSVGGIFLLSGFVSVLLYDYLHDIDFALESTIMRFSLKTFTPENSINYYKKVVQGDWDVVDFSKFSKVKNPDLKKYDFSFKAIIGQLD